MTIQVVCDGCGLVVPGVQTSYKTLRSAFPHWQRLSDGMDLCPGCVQGFAAWRKERVLHYQNERDQHSA